MLVGLPACMEKDGNVEFDISVFLHAGMHVIQSLHTSGALITLKVLLVTVIRDDSAIQQSIAYVSYFQLVSPVS